MISSLVQGYGSEDESDAEEGKGEKKNTKQEDNDTGTAKRELRRRPLSVPSTLENSSRRSKQHRHTQNKNKDKINPEIQARVEKYLEAKKNDSNEHKQSIEGAERVSQTRISFNLSSTTLKWNKMEVSFQDGEKKKSKKRKKTHTRE